MWHIHADGMLKVFAQLAMRGSCWLMRGVWPLRCLGIWALPIQLVFSSGVVGMCFGDRDDVRTLGPLWNDDSNELM